MKKFILLLLIATAVYSQSNVDKLVDQLNQLSEVTFNNWKYSTNFSLKPEEISKSGFDDSQWQTASLNQRFTLDSCWFRKEIELPQRISGMPLHGRI